MKIGLDFARRTVLAVEEVVRDLLQLPEEEVGRLGGPSDDPEVAHRVEEERQDDGEAETGERLKCERPLHSFMIIIMEQGHFIKALKKIDY